MKFKIGDKVKVIKGEIDSDRYIGAIGYVSKVYNDSKMPVYTVETKYGGKISSFLEYKLSIFKEESNE